MTLNEFLRWEDGTDTRYELLWGVPVAMAPPAEAHRILAMRLGSRVDTALANRRPYNAQNEAGVVYPHRDDSFFVADTAATCHPNERRRQAIKSPILLVEILSPRTERHDRQVRVPPYRGVDSVNEIPLIYSESIYAEKVRREGDRWITELVQGRDATLRLSSVDLRIAMEELYEGLDIDAENAA